MQPIELALNNPVVYARFVLKVYWWEKQVEIARAVINEKKVLVRSANTTGKSHIAAGLVNWGFDRLFPCTIITTAPTQPQVEDILWREIRAQRGSAGLDMSVLSPKAPRMERGDSHFAVGLTARDESAFQGKHNRNVFGVMDEATGIAPEFWDAMDSMLSGGDNAYFLGIYNPTDKTAAVYDKEMSGKYHVISISALEHPNITAELAGLPPPIPSAIRLAQIQERFADLEYFEPITHGTENDVEFPPNSGIWYAPTPLGESRILGRWAAQGLQSVWGEKDISAICKPQELQGELALGCDVAGEGADLMVVFVRRGASLLYCEVHNGWQAPEIEDLLVRLCEQYTKELNEGLHGAITQKTDARLVKIVIDETGLGWGVVGGVKRRGYSARGINFGSEAQRSERYPNKRSELWFNTVAMAKKGSIDISRLPEKQKQMLMRELQSPKWSTDKTGRRIVEPKKDTKNSLGKSPDYADAFNLCYYPVPSMQFYTI